MISCVPPFPLYKNNIIKKKIIPRGGIVKGITFINIFLRDYFTYLKGMSADLMSKSNCFEDK